MLLHHGRRARSRSRRALKMNRGVRGTPFVVAVLMTVLQACPGSGVPPDSCSAPLVSCGGACKNLNGSDDANCGDCQRACPSDTHCRAGVCTSSQDQGCTVDTRQPQSTVETCCRKTVGECPGLGQRKCLVGLGTPPQCCENWTRPYVSSCTTTRNGVPVATPNDTTMGCDPCL